MKKKISKRVSNQEQFNEGQNLMNGLMAVIQGLGYGTPYGTEALSNTDTLFKNNRWYLISNFRQVLSEVYAELALIQNFVDVPVDDSFAHGYEITSKQLSNEQIKVLTDYIDRHRINGVITQALKWTRLFGGGGIMIITDQDPTTELSVESIQTSGKIKFRAVDMWELFYSKQNVEDTKAQLLPEDDMFYNYYGQKVHKSRVLIMKGQEAPSFIRPRLRGWGLSILEKVVRSINQYLKSNNLVFEVLDEFKLDIFKIKNLNQSLMSNGGTDKIKTRIQLANQTKNYQNSIVMDGEDDYTSKSLSFAGLPEMIREFRIQIASDLRMPMTKLFGISASGFNAGEDDIENYNAMVESEIRSKVKYDVLRVLELCCAVLFGMVPEDLQISWPSLRVLSDEQTETVKTAKLNRILQCVEKGIITSEEVIHAINKDEILPVKISGSEIDFEAKEEEQPEEGEKEVAKEEKKENANLTTPIGKWYAEVFEKEFEDSPVNKIYECYGSSEKDVVQKCQDFIMKEDFRRKQLKQEMGITEIKTKSIE